jgi:pilus assembly protein CpaF
MTKVLGDLSPLHDIEQRVQDRARTLALDAEHDHDELRRLVSDAVDQWSLDHRRGTRPFDLADPDGIVERAMRNLTGYGPLEPLLADDDVWEIMINAPTEALPRSATSP